MFLGRVVESYRRLFSLFVSRVVAPVPVPEVCPKLQLKRKQEVAAAFTSYFH
jgi:hypothetical protein